MKLSNESHINGSWEFLNLIEQVVAFLQCGFIVLVSFIAWVGFNDPLDLVNLAGKSSGWNQFRKLSINKVNRNSELIGHWLKSHSFVGFQELCINYNSGLSDKISWVKINVFVFLHIINNPQKVGEKVSVSAVIETFKIILDFW